MTLTANWSYPTAIRFGAGRIAELPAACRQAGITRPLLASLSNPKPVHVTVDTVTTWL